MENKKRRVGGYLIWLGIPILIIAALYYISGNKKPEEHKYSEIMEYFTVGTSANQSEWKSSQVSDFNLSLNTGVLTINLKEDKSGKKPDPITYKVPSIELFVNDAKQGLRELREKNIIIGEDYEPKQDNSLIASLLPTIIMIGGLVLLYYFMFKRVNGVMGESNRQLNFGKAKIKNVNDEKRKTTFDDVAGAQKDSEHTVNIVVDETATLAQPLIDSYRETREIGWFIPPDAALDAMTDNSLLIIVDTHSPDVIESKAVYNAAATVVTIDHHRLSVKRIQNSVIFFHEPYASSTCEMVTELAPYMHETAIARPEAEALLSGIMLDTKSFVLKTGARTFEAAAYLRRRGADTIEVKRFFSGSLQTYIEKSQLVSSARLYGDCAISVAPEEVEGIRVIASQAADELLNINGVTASFVLYVMGSQINISARSLGRFNVQLVMEKLGGGGHMTMAAAQMYETTVDQAIEKLKAAIDEFRVEQVRDQTVAAT